ncbi:MAG TPA: iron ABC transporter permease [Gemmatimonadaceae bacterium]|nr:iron ABC transporter permease [Gemmatimonadaceae bacterium]
MIARHAWLRWSSFALGLVVALLLAIALGTIALSPSQVWHALLGRGDAAAITIVQVLRLPRAVLAALIGAGLGISGAALQGTMRNPLAEPYLLGVSGGAAVGAVVAVSLGLSITLVPIAAFGGAIAAVLLAFFVAHAAGTRGDARILLMAGVVVGAFANSVIMLVLGSAPSNVVRDAVWWMMGSVAAATWTDNAWLFGYLVVGGGALFAWARRIDVLALGDDTAAALGLDPERTARTVYAAASLVAAATVSAAGLVGFVGLVVPHIVRSTGVRRHLPLLVGSALVGAALVVLADLAARTIRPPAELPLGAVTAIVGVPFFLARLRRLV